jgi:hypothetical protein
MASGGQRLRAVSGVRALTYIVPSLFFGFVLWRGRRDLVYILALPLLLAFNRGIFLDLYSFQWGFGGITTFGQEDVMLLVLMFVYAYVRAVRPRAAPERMTLQLYLCIGILILLLFKALAGSLPIVAHEQTPSHILAIILNSRTYFYLPISIILWHLVLKRFSRQEMNRLLGLLTWVTLAVSVVYLANLAGAQTYGRIWSPYSASPASGDLTVFRGVAVSRDYLTFPFWLYVALGFSLANVVYGRLRGTYFLVALVVTACAVFSFTRAFAACAVGLWIVALLWRLVVVPRQRQRPSVQAPVRPARVPIVAGVLALTCLAVVFRWSAIAAWVAYLEHRVGSSLAGGTSDATTAWRISLYSIAARSVARDGPVLGTLMTSLRASPGVYFLDSYWSLVLFALGWLGLLVVSALALAAVGKATLHAMRSDGEAVELRTALLLALVAAIALTFTGSGFAYAVTASVFLLAAADVRFLHEGSIGEATHTEGAHVPNRLNLASRRRLANPSPESTQQTPAAARSASSTTPGA